MGKGKCQAIDNTQIIVKFFFVANKGWVSF